MRMPMLMPSYLLQPTLLLAGIVAASVSSPALAAAEPSTRLVSCRSGSCLLVSGHRDSPAAAVSINGHPVAAEGGRNWRVRLPVETVRAWSQPFARTITVSLTDTGADTTAEADLPIGLLGHVENLAVLFVSAK